MRAFFVICAVVLIPGIGYLILMAEKVFVDPGVTQAFVAGGFLTIGWFVTYVLREVATISERRQRSLDLQTAVRAEIFDYLEALEDDDPAATADAVGAKIMAGGDAQATAYHPFVPRISRPALFEHVAPEISILPERAIDNVVQFYSVLSDITRMSEDLAQDSFRSFSAEQREGALRDYMSMRAMAQRLANEAVCDLDETIRDTRKRNLAVMLGLRSLGTDKAKRAAP